MDRTYTQHYKCLACGHEFDLTVQEPYLDAHCCPLIFCLSKNIKKKGKVIYGVK